MDDDDNKLAGSDSSNWVRPPGSRETVLAVNGVIAAVGGTYASTHSLAATMMAGCAGLACAALAAWKK